MNPAPGTGGRRALCHIAPVTATLLTMALGCVGATGSSALPESPGLEGESRPASEMATAAPKAQEAAFTQPAASQVVSLPTDIPTTAGGGCSFPSAMSNIQEAVFQLIVYRPDGVDLGTAFYIGNGDYLTAAHLVADTTAVRLRNSGADLPATVIAIDQRSDLALLHSAESPSEPLQFRDSADIWPGQVVAAVGYPLYEEYSASITGGLISRLIEDRTLGLLIQTDAPINRGNSGGPLVDQCGRVVGMAVEKWFEEGVDGMAWAVSAREIEAALADLRGVPAPVLADLRGVPAPVVPASPLSIPATELTPAVRADPPSIRPQEFFEEVQVVLGDYHDRIETAVRSLDSGRSDATSQAAVLWSLAQDSDAYRQYVASGGFGLGGFGLGGFGSSCDLALETYARALGWTSRLAGYHAAQLWNPGEDYRSEQIEALRKSREIVAAAAEHSNECADGR